MSRQESHLEMRGPGHSRSPMLVLMHAYGPLLSISSLSSACAFRPQSWKTLSCAKCHGFAGVFCLPTCVQIGYLDAVRSWPWCQKIPPSPVLLRLLLGKNPAHVPAFRAGGGELTKNIRITPRQAQKTHETIESNPNETSRIDADIPQSLERQDPQTPKKMVKFQATSSS